LEPVLPMLAVRTDIPSLIEINGNFLGEASAHAHVAMPLSDTGDYYVCAIPLMDQKNIRRFAVTRKLAFKGGALCEPEAEDVKVCAWPGGVYELELFPGAFPERQVLPFPYVIEEVYWREGERELCCTLYFEDGLKLSVEESHRILAGYCFGDGREGKLTLLDMGGERILLVKSSSEEQQRLTAFRFSGEVILDLFADEVGVEEGCPTAIHRLDTLKRHERRKKYDLQNGIFVQLEEEIGFFTCGEPEVKKTRETAICFCEAMREGFFEEAGRYLDESTLKGLDLLEVQEFIGDFVCCRTPFSDPSGSLLGLIRKGTGRIETTDLYRFTFENGKIANIEKA